MLMLPRLSQTHAPLVHGWAPGVFVPLRGSQCAPESYETYTQLPELSAISTVPLAEAATPVQLPASTGTSLPRPGAKGTVGASVGASVGVDVGTLDGAEVGVAVGACVVGPAVGVVVGCIEGRTGRSRVGDGVGSTVGCKVGRGVGGADVHAKTPAGWS